MRNPCLAAALEELDKAGVRHPEIARGSKHLQISFYVPRRHLEILFPFCSIPLCSDFNHLHGALSPYER